jgi:hypothetical protein
VVKTEHSSSTSPRATLSSPNTNTAASAGETPSTVTTALNVSINSSPRLSQQSSNESSASSATTASSSALAQTTTDILSRIERSGRALRKSAAIDSEDHVLTTNTAGLLQQPQSIQPASFQLASLQQGHLTGIMTEEIIKIYKL